MRVWLEVTNRSDLGANLKAPQADENGRDYWSYSLITHVRDGDTILHYHKPAQAIIARSRASGRAWEDTIIWGARGATARSTGTVPHSRHGWCLALESFEYLPEPLSLEEIRRNEHQVKAVRGLLSGDAALYFPFALSDGAFGF